MTNGINGSALRVSGARAFFGSGILLLILAILFAPAFAAAPSVLDAARANSRLSSLQIEI